MEIGTQFGQLVLGRIVEKYWAATVYLATPLDGNDSQQYLLTKISPRPNYAPEQIKAHLECIYQLDHPNILPLIEVAEADDGTFHVIVESLPALIPEHGNLSVDTVLAFSKQISAALDYIHLQGVSHGNLLRAHIVHDGQGNVYLRGLELRANETDAEPGQDIIAFSKLVQQAFTGIAGDASQLRGFPRSIIAVLRHAQRGGFESAGAFHSAFTRAVKSSETLPVTPPPASQTAPKVAQKPALNRPSQLSLLISLMIPILGGIVGSILFLNRIDQHVPQAAEPTIVVAAPSLTPSPVPPTVAPTLASSPTVQSANTPAIQPTLSSTPVQVMTATDSPNNGTVAPTSANSVVNGAVITNTAVAPDAIVVPDAIVNVDDGVILRGGPSRDYFAIMTLHKDRTMNVLSRTADSQWLQVRADKSEGWVAAQYVTVNINLANIQVITSEEIDRLPRTRNCVSLVGDSIPHGDAIVEFPDVGFAMVNLEPLGSFLDQKLKSLGITDMMVVDRSVSGTGISFAVRSKYTDTGQYKSLLGDKCRFIVILPWVGDLSQSTDHATAAPVHAAALTDLVRTVATYNAYSRILVMKYYIASPSTLMQTTLAKGFNTDGVKEFNKAITAACTSGELSTMKQVTCLDTESAFSGLGLNYLVGTMTHQQFDSDIIGGMDDNETNLMKEYLAAHPEGTFIGDGIHLNTLGKTILAEFLAKYVTTMPEYKPDETPVITPTP